MPFLGSSNDVDTIESVQAVDSSVLSGHRVLLVDDDPSVRRMLRDRLQVEGCQVSTAEDGMEAITVFEEQGADLLILDIKMPGMDGFEVCETIKRSSNVPVIFLTGANDPMIKNYLPQIVEAASGDYCMRKPFEMQVLLSLVREALPS